MNFPSDVDDTMSQKLVICGGRPDDFEKYYDEKTGCPGNGNFGGKVYFTYSQLVAVKVALLEKRRLIGNTDADFQGALDLILQALGEVDPNAEGSI